MSEVGGWVSVGIWSGGWGGGENVDLVSSVTVGLVSGVGGWVSVGIWSGGWGGGENVDLVSSVTVGLVSGVGGWVSAGIWSGGWGGRENVDLVSVLQVGRGWHLDGSVLYWWLVMGRGGRGSSGHLVGVCWVWLGQLLGVGRWGRRG